MYPPEVKVEVEEIYQYIHHSSIGDPAHRKVRRAHSAQKTRTTYKSLMSGAEPGCRVATLLNGANKSPPPVLDGSNYPDWMDTLHRIPYTLHTIIAPHPVHVQIRTCTPINAPTIDSPQLSYALTIHSAEKDLQLCSTHMGSDHHVLDALTFLSHLTSGREDVPPAMCHCPPLLSDWSTPYACTTYISASLPHSHNARDTYPHATLYLQLNQLSSTSSSARG